MACSPGFCRQYSCCCLIPSVSWGAQLVAWFHLVVCAFVLVAFASTLDAVSVAVIAAEILMQ